MSQIIDNLITFRILHILLQPIEKSDAFQLGIVDKNGKKIKTPSTDEERDSYTNLNKLAFKVKNLLLKVPQSDRELQNLAASVHMVKECYEQSIKDVEGLFEDRLNNINEQECINIKNLILGEERLSFQKFLEDAPANNASATPGVAGFTPSTVGVKKSKVLRRNKIKNFKSF